MRDGGVGIIPAYAGSTFVPAAGGEPGDGSSPHTRGARGLRGPLDGSAGIIPAYAGSTANLGGVVGVVEDHPRIRGEHRILPPDQTLPGGSSPHTRGALLLDRPLIHRGRIIPAYAGSTSACRRCGPPMWDHPRIRGEHLANAASITNPYGSSPHTRGARSAACRNRALHGDHPRIRGEHIKCSRNKWPKTGSSPHTRGAHPSAVRRRAHRRIIPAYAGSTYRIGLSGGASQDHPRIRGEHACGASVKGTLSGSSPHTRGALGRTAGSGFRRRIIPAYAGSTAAGSLCRGRLTDHPRIRGEHAALSASTASFVGSSPHTRGARHERPRRRRHRRIIPAYAGSTARISPCFDWGRGSSPHTRGALERGIVRPLMIRIIPAYAGSTPAVACPAPADGDHPRIRGEHEISQYRAFPSVGSSPHTRGAPRARWRLGSCGRIIPAYAGSTRFLMGFLPPSGIIPAYAGSTR